MRKILIYTIVSSLIIVAFFLVASGELVQTLAGCALMAAMRWVFKKTSRGKKWWKTWYRVGYSFQLYLGGRLGK